MNLIQKIADVLLDLKTETPLIIGINGIDGSGKTEFAKQLAQVLSAKTDRPVVTISIDGFHNPRQVRYAKGRGSAEGFYRDSFNLEAFKSHVLEPLRNNKGTYVPQIFDVRADESVIVEPQLVTSDAIVLVEGIFLFQTELAAYFDFKIFLDVPFAVALQRMLKRDRALYTSREEEIELFETRYQAGQLIYFAEARPKEQADVVIDNSDYNNPKIAT